MVKVDKESATLAVAVAGVILQAVTVWQNRKRNKRKGRHRRE